MKTFSHEYFQNKIVWLVGASSGIGAAMANHLASHGATVVISARNLTSLKEIQTRHPSRIKVVDFDLQNPDERARSLPRVQALTDRIDLFIYCAGITQRSLAVDTELATVRTIMEVNFFGAVDLSTRLLKQGMLKDASHLVVISSVVGHVGTPKRSAYAASKHALHGYFNALRAELHERKIAVSIISPGYVATGIDTRAVTADGSLQQQVDGNRPKGLSAEAFADKALVAIAKRRPEAYIGGGEIIAIYLQRFFPSLIYRQAHKFAPEVAKTP